MRKIVLTIMLVLLTVGNAEAGWKENLKKTRDGIKKTTKKTTKGIKKTTKKAKESWDKRESPCTRCGKLTKLGKWCADCKKKSVADTGREIGKRGKKVIETGKKGAQQIEKKYKKWSPVVEKKYKETLNNIKNPEKRAKAKKALVKTTKIASQIRQAKKNGIYLGLSKTTSIRLPEELGGKTLGEEMGERLIKICPELAGSGIDEDPALAITAALCLDPVYFVKDLTLIKRDGRNVSLAESAKMSSSFNASGAIKSFKAIAAAERIASGEGDIGDLVDLGNGINSVNKK
jgi:hypothetical protein